MDAKEKLKEEIFEYCFGREPFTEYEQLADEYTLDAMERYAQEYHKSKSLSEHSNRVELLVKYSEWLEKECFLDSDWRQEARTVDEYLKTLKK